MAGRDKARVPMPLRAEGAATAEGPFTAPSWAPTAEGPTIASDVDRNALAVGPGTKTDAESNDAAVMAVTCARDGDVNRAAADTAANSLTSTTEIATPLPTATAACACAAPSVCTCRGSSSPRCSRAFKRGAGRWASSSVNLPRAWFGDAAPEGSVWRLDLTRDPQTEAARLDAARDRISRLSSRDDGGDFSL